jgi:5-methylthioadenosine/S-adenosylhomocysteine deaminase
VLIGSDGRIAAVGPDASVPTPDDAAAPDLGRAVLLPGLVNVHTHLELTGLDGQAPETDFRDWILAIRRIKSLRTAAEYLASARQGVHDCWAGGVTTIADTGDSGSVARVLAELGGSGVIYQEVFGPHPGQCAESLTGLERCLSDLAAQVKGRIRLGASPHAPYTVSGPLFAQTAIWAREHGYPLALHLAESKEEVAFVRDGLGPFADGWRARGIPLLDDPSHQPPVRPPARPSPVGWLDAHGVLGPDTLCIHAVQLSPADIELLARRGVAIAHCPRSNARHGHGTAPVSALRRAGLRIGLGTDSVASIGRLDMFAEMREAMSLGNLDAGEVLALATRDGARALGLESELGTLTPGKWGDVVAVRAGSAGGSSPERAVLLASPASVRLTVLGGREVYRSPGAA